jgi:hypothetical protein
MKNIILYNQHIGVEKSQEVDQEATNLAGPGDPIMRDIWTLVFTDKAYGDRIMIAIGRETRDTIVLGLTDGRVLAGGELPRL